MGSGGKGSGWMAPMQKSLARNWDASVTQLPDIIDNTISLLGQEDIQRQSDIEARKNQVLKRSSSEKLTTYAGNIKEDPMLKQQTLLGS